MAPTKIMMIRHGEKQKYFPGDKDIGQDGQIDKASLNHRGWRRAAALAHFFKTPQTANVLTPEWIFAAAPDEHSKRPMQTVTPVAMLLWPDALQRAQHFNALIGVDDIDGLYAKVLSKDSVVLVCWEHSRIPDIAALLHSEPPSPSSWDDLDFDSIWIFDATDQGWTYTLGAEGLNNA